MDRTDEAIEHFGYDARDVRRMPNISIGATAHNREPFENFAEIVKLYKINYENKKTRIVFDYDPDFEHCLIQFIEFP